jgi:hypothetical protein
MKRVLAAFFLVVFAAAAAGIDGRWTSTVAARGKAGKKGAAKGPTEVVLSLRNDGGHLTGSVLRAGGKKARPLTIQDGTLTGDSFSFTTVQKTKKGEQKATWRGTLRGDELTGTRTREGGRRGRPFTARRQG